ncbi:SDR family oxidoreductase [Actinokineospora bangkokensis]|uniref:NAD(P)-dependent oxidoreductase n=1 Tax=Actinokineospora bangkokensis TaxID=1193682 RepID=A0A1Q9LD11_9PSEU|nr:SDR family oxidoreductase [Actinokineospora bangkokensis]OLR89903.1 NAD(P)-dependent oxidoreductase [Actinokineospora bangkokensis]
MKYLVTGATGHFGALAVRHLLTRVPAADVVVSVRDPRKAADLAAQGVEVRRGDFTDPASLDFSGVDKLLLVSSDGPNRVADHRAAIDAAVRAGVRHIAYTSVTDADSSPVNLAADHKATEEALRASGVAHTFLRNGMYHENYTPSLAQGAVVTAAGTGRIASASRSDLAEAAAVVLTGEGHEGKAYELTGPRAWGFDELAALAGLRHTAVTAAERKAGLVGFGLPEPLADLLTDIEVNIGAGVFERVRPDLAELLGRAATPVEDAAKAALG